MKSFFLSMILLIFSINCIHAQVAGGYMKAEVDDLEVANAANFAMKAREKALRKSDKDTNVSLVEIIRASKQVVAGMNYKMTLKVNINYKDQIVEVVVFKNLSDEYELTSWEHKPVKKKESETSR